MRSTFATTFLVLLLSLTALSQIQTGRIGDPVTDSSGAVIPAAGVTVTNAGTNQSKNFVADERGRFVFTDFQPGPTFGRLTSRRYRPRQIQFGLKIIF